MAKRSGTKQKGRYEKVRSDLKQFDGMRLDVGYFAGQKGGKSSSNFLLPDIAAVQEFGSHPRKKFNRVPQRSFLGYTYDLFRRVYSRNFRRNGMKVIEGKMTSKQALLSVGEDYRRNVVQRIVGVKSPRNAPRTIKEKGFDNPLIHTGTMKNNIRLRVLRRGIV